MKVTGSHTVAAPRERVWEALQDPDVLVRTLPGCRELECVGTDEYTATVSAGVGSIKGIYSGRVVLADQDPPTGYTLKASGQGAPGTIDATARVTLEETDDGATIVSYEADAAVGGQVAGVGQRVLAGVARRNAGEFFAAVDRVLAEGPAAAVAPGAGAPAQGAPGAEAPAEGAPGAGAPVAAPGVGRVYRAPERPAPAADPALLLGAAVAGAVIALAGVAVGRRSARR